MRALRTEQRVQKKDRLYNFICSNQISLNLNTNRVLWNERGSFIIANLGGWLNYAVSWINSTSSCFFPVRVQSVSTFRAEVLRQAAINVYKPPVDQPEKPLSVVKVKGQELFPTHFEREKLHDRRRNTRYRTTPVTSHELYDIPEGGPQQQSRGPKPMDTGPLSRLDPYYIEGSPSQQRSLADTRCQDYPVRTIYNLGEENIGQEEGLDEYQQWIGETSENRVFYEERSHWTKEERTKAETEDELCKLVYFESLFYVNSWTCCRMKWKLWGKVIKNSGLLSSQQRFHLVQKSSSMCIYNNPYPLLIQSVLDANICQYFLNLHSIKQRRQQSTITTSILIYHYHIYTKLNLYYTKPTLS